MPTLWVPALVTLWVVVVLPVLVLPLPAMWAVPFRTAQRLPAGVRIRQVSLGGSLTCGGVMPLLGCSDTGFV